MKLLFIGIFLSVLFFYLSIRGIEIQEVSKGLSQINYIYLTPAVMLSLLGAYLRSVRWGIILLPLEKISQIKLFPISCVGFMAIILFPVRMGELVRPYLLKKESRIPISSTLATVFLERILDILVLTCILIIVIINSTLPSIIVNTGYNLLFAIFLFILLTFLFCHKKSMAIRILTPLFRRMPGLVGRRAEKIFSTFVDVLIIISSPKRLFFTLLLSIIYWGIAGATIYCLFFSQNIYLPLMSAFVVLVITVLGITLPSAPGLLGNFQIGCITALSIYGISKSEAFLFSIIFYIFDIGINTLLGIIFLPLINISLRDIRISYQKEKK